MHQEGLVEFSRHVQIGEPEGMCPGRGFRLEADAVDFARSRVYVIGAALRHVVFHTLLLSRVPAMAERDAASCFRPWQAEGGRLPCPLPPGLRFLPLSLKVIRQGFLVFEILVDSGQIVIRDRGEDRACGLLAGETLAVRDQLHVLQGSGDTVVPVLAVPVEIQCGVQHAAGVDLVAFQDDMYPIYWTNQ